jgi:hypothetical protein
MEAKREQNIKASKSFVPSIEITFGDGKSMTKMECTIHVWKREGHKVLLLFIGFCSEKVMSFPN